MMYMLLTLSFYAVLNLSLTTTYEPHADIIIPVFFKKKKEPRLGEILWPFSHSSKNELGFWTQLVGFQSPHLHHHTQLSSYHTNVLPLSKETSALCNDFTINLLCVCTQKHKTPIG
jgi:hypothetical protein